MAKVHSNGVVSLAFLAGEDMSASAVRYKFVSFSSSADKVVLATGGSLPAPFGILQNSPCSGEEAEIAGPGSYSKLRVIASTSLIGTGGLLYCGSAGVGERQTSASAYAHAMALEAVASGSAIIEVYVLPPGAISGAAS